MYPGALPNIKANLFNVVLVVDLSKISTLNFLAGAVSSIINRDIPLRFGMVPVSESEDGQSILARRRAVLKRLALVGRKMAKLFYHLITNHGRRKTLEFLSAVRPLYSGPLDVGQWD